MQFRLSTIFLLFLVLWSSMGLLGVGGILGFVLVVGLAIAIARAWLPWFFVFAAAVGFLFALLTPRLPTARDPSAACCNHLCRISAALDRYCQATGHFPPACVADRSGKPMHSWRVLLLPYFGDRSLKSLFDQYDFSEPWDGPHNQKLLTARPSVYACLSDDRAPAQGETCTNYVAVVGPDAAWSTWSAGQPSRLPGDLWKSALLAEIAAPPIAWTEPKDVSLDALRGALTSREPTSGTPAADASLFAGTVHTGFYVALADSGVLLVERGQSDSQWPIHWSNAVGVAVWFFTILLLLRRAVHVRGRAILLAAEPRPERRSDA